MQVVAMTRRKRDGAARSKDLGQRTTDDGGRTTEENHTMQNFGRLELLGVDLQAKLAGSGLSPQVSVLRLRHFLLPLTFECT